MRGDQCFTFADAEDLLPYLDDLGVSHLYLSPILTAAHGSTHGYDVTDPTTVSAELGGADGLARLSAAARSRGMGLIVDIVPNHVGVDKPEQNKWWWDVLKHGRESPCTRRSSISTGRWTTAESCCRCWVPTTTSTTSMVDGDVLRLGDLALSHRAGHRRGHRPRGARPPALPPDRLAQRDMRLPPVLLDHLAGRAAPGGPRGVRRHPCRGQALVRRRPGRRRAHRPPGRIVRSRGLSGAGCARSPGRDAWIVIEKILAVDEPLDPSLPVAGTTGYDALREVGGLFIDPTRRPPAHRPCRFDRHRTTTRCRNSPAALKVRAVTDTLGSELSRLCRTVTAATDYTHP